MNARIDIALPGPGVSIELPRFPRFVRLPGHPVHVAPEVPANYFFCASLFWVLEGADWYAGGWYNGPWEWISPAHVPDRVLQIPVSAFRSPPAYFKGWAPFAPPRWGDHWGAAWRRTRPKWAQRQRGPLGQAEVPSPLPVHQRLFCGADYPSRELQRLLAAQGR